MKSAGEGCEVVGRSCERREHGVELGGRKIDPVREVLVAEVNRERHHAHVERRELLWPQVTRAVSDDPDLGHGAPWLWVSRGLFGSHEDGIERLLAAVRLDVDVGMSHADRCGRVRASGSSSKSSPASSVSVSAPVGEQQVGEV